MLKTEKGRASVFANGHIMIIAGKKEAEELLRDVCQTILRVQMCTRCKERREELPARGNYHG